MNRKYIISGLICAFVIIGWNAFLIHRDSELYDFDNYQHAKERYCKNLSHWHPDCNIK